MNTFKTKEHIKRRSKRSKVLNTLRLQLGIQSKNDGDLKILQMTSRLIQSQKRHIQILEDQIQNLASSNNIESNAHQRQQINQATAPENREKLIEKLRLQVDEKNREINHLKITIRDLQLQLWPPPFECE